MRRATDTLLVERSGDLVAGRYRIMDLIGVGTTGSVWVAEQMALRTRVVVKFHETGFDGEEDGSEGLLRFLREARLLASVRHRNVSEHYESGTTAAGEPYLIMEHLRGETLEERIEWAGKLPLREAFRTVTGIAAGLEALHNAEILHRDIKPEHIILHNAADETAVVPKLIDFGFARGIVNKGIPITGFGTSVVGTPGYMSPEQSEGRSDLDGRTDQFSLGVCLYRMLTGNLPIEGESDEELALGQLKPSALTELLGVPGLRLPAAENVLRMLRSDRRERFPDSRAMRLALERVGETLE